MHLPGADAGNRLPYAPKQQAPVTPGYIASAGWDAQLETVYVSEQFSDFANTAAASTDGNGQTGIIDSYTICNAAFGYHLKQPRLSLFAALKGSVLHADQDTAACVGVEGGAISETPDLGRKAHGAGARRRQQRRTQRIQAAANSNSAGRRSGTPMAVHDPG